MESIERFFSTWRFAVASISLIFFSVGLMAAVLLVPAPPGPAEAFAEAFKVWCFGYDPATGTYEWGYVWMFLIQPLVMLAVIAMIWGKTFGEARQAGFKRLMPYVGLPLLLVLLGGAALTQIGGSDTEASRNDGFPAERIRTTHQAAAFSLISHRNRAVTTSDLQGRPLLVTAVYTSCAMTCPMILNQVRGVLQRLSREEQDRLAVAVLTLDPETDTPQTLAALANAHGLDEEYVHFLTGSVDAVDETLDAYGFTRVRDPETGALDHANLFLLVDADGRIAYRFSLGDTQEDWMVEAVKHLLKETPEHS